MYGRGSKPVALRETSPSERAAIGSPHAFVFDDGAQLGIMDAELDDRLKFLNSDATSRRELHGDPQSVQGLAPVHSQVNSEGFQFSCRKGNVLVELLLLWN